MRRLVSILTMMVMLIGSLVGCGSSETSTSSNEQSKDAKIIRYNNSTDPQTLDPALNTGTDGSRILVNLYEGLMKLDENDKAVPGIAQKVDISEDGLTYTFHLRDSKWSDGKPLTAKDFEYSWKRALDAKTSAEYAYQLYYIKNGENFYTGKCTADDVGVKAIDDKTLQVVLNSRVPYFLELTAFPTYFPVRSDMVELANEKWALNPETAISNGPFKMNKWAHNDVIEVRKNENYYDADRVKIDGVDFVMINEATTSFTAFESGDIDAMGDIPSQQIPILKEKKDPNFKIYPQLGVYYYSFNVNVEPTNDPKVRRALSLAIDRKQITDIVCKGGQIPATTFVPKGIKDPDGKDFTQSAKDYGLKETASIKEAQKLLAEAGYPDGKGFPEVTLIYNTGEGHKSIAEAVQEMWKQNLGITTVQLQNQEWKVFQETRRKGDFVVARDGWVADYVDPMTFLDMFISSSGNNHAQYKNDEYDKLISSARVCEDLNERMNILHSAEDMIMDESIAMPIYYYTNPEMIRDNIKGVRTSPLGFTYFDNATIE